MQLVSCSPGLRIDIRAAASNFTQKGDRLPDSPALWVQFQPGGNVPDYAKAEVEKLPGFRTGIGRDEDPFLTRLGWYDTVVAQQELGLSDADREFMEQRLLQIADPNVIVLEQQRVEAPYGRYDQHRNLKGRRQLEHVLADIQAVYDLAGFDAEQAVAYERQNLDDPQVVEFLQGLGAPVEGAEELVPA